MKTNCGAAEAQLKMLGKTDYGPQLASIRCPVLVVSGEADQVIPASNAETLFNDLTGSTLRQLRIEHGARSGRVSSPDDFP